MLQWAMGFLVIALVAALFGFGGVALISIELARMLFFVFIALFAIAMFAHSLGGRAPPV